MKKIYSFIMKILVTVLVISSVNFAYAADRELTNDEKAAFIVRDEWTGWVRDFTASLSELDKLATARIYDNMDFYDMQYRFTEKYKKVPEYLDEDGKPTQKLKDMIKLKRKQLAGATIRDYLCFTSKQDGSTVKLQAEGSAAISNIQLGISTDGTSFIPWDGTAKTINSGEKIYVLNKSTNLSTSTANYYHFVVTGTVEASGDACSMINFGAATDYCFYKLFNSQTALTSLPEVQLTTTASYCCYEMFSDCTNAVTGPSVLPASSVAQEAYRKMFSTCMHLVSAPTILAKSVGDSACRAMFQNCRALIVAPELPATTLAEYCYYSMFQNCPELVTPPSVLPATTVPANAYYRMFQFCTKLEKSPIIKGKTLSNGSLGRMFDGCSVLNEIYLDNYVGNFDSNYFEEWVSGVASSGILYYKGSDTTVGVSAIPTGWVAINDDLDFLKFTAKANSVVRWSRNGAPDVDIYYSKNGARWEKWTVNTDVSLTNGDNIRVWNSKNRLSSASTKYVYFVMSGRIAASGNCNSLQNFVQEHYAYAFYNLFNGCAALVSAPDIPGNADGNYCFASMFRNTGISSVVLQSTTSSDDAYTNMFYGCSSLREITIAYTGNFNSWQFSNWVGGVASAGSFYYDGNDTTRGTGAIPVGWTVKSPLTFKSTAMGSKVKYVLNGGLVRNNILYRKNSGEWKEWPANSEIILDTNDTLKVWNKDGSLSLSSSSYFKFVITGSVEANKDIASLLNYSNSLSQYCYYKLFDGCTGLTAAPALPATTLASSCYQDMFNGCTSITTAPALAVMTLAQSCYQGMFGGCTGLTSAPELPATTLAANCYSNIFNGCTNLNYINIGYSGAITTAYFNNWVNGVSNTGSILYSGTTNTFGPSALPKDSTNQWSILQPLTFTAKANDTEIFYLLNGLVKNNIYYKLNDGAWTKWEAEEANKITLSNGQTLSVWNKDNTLSSFSERFEFKMPNGSVEITGDVQSMINYAPLHDYCFANMFNQCQAITKVSKINIDTLAPCCYQDMFSSCVNLVDAPELPATNLDVLCYNGMFDGCTSLKRAPHLPATTLADSCYKEMFNGCTSLEYITIDYTGAFDATHFENWVANVNQSGLFKYLGTSASYGANAIPNGWLIVPSGDSFTLTSKAANSSVSYKYLDRDRGELSPTYEYARLYYSKNGGDWNRWNRNTAIQLNNNDVLEVRNATSTLTYWGGSAYVIGVTFVMSGNIEASGDITALMNYNPIYSSCFKALFYNCSALTKAPELPSDIAAGCYYEMFMNCTSLEKAPRLKSTSLADSCYNFMFSGCTSLNEIKIDYAGELGVGGTDYWVTGVTGTGTLYYNGPTTTHSGDAIPTNFTVQTFTP